MKPYQNPAKSNDRTVKCRNTGATDYPCAGLDHSGDTMIYFNTDLTVLRCRVNGV